MTGMRDTRAARTSAAPEAGPSGKQGYDPESVEARWYRFWEEHNLFHADETSGSPHYCIVIPPPNVTGSLHMGHALNNSLQDILIRWHQMRGDNTLWMPGTDHAGIATQNVVERQLRQEGLTRDQVGREAFVERVWTWKRESGGAIIRQVRTQQDQLFDHYAVEYSFADGTRLFAHGRHMGNCWGFFGDIIHGANGSAVLGEGIPQPRIFKTHSQTTENILWMYKGPGCDQYQVEHDLLFAAIRENKPYNETERCAYATLTGGLGRMAAEAGALITWEQALASNIEQAPGLDNLTMSSDAPVKPDAAVRSPVAMPGITKVL